MGDGYKSSTLQNDSFKEEIIIESSEPRNWKGIFIALLVISTICGVILIAIFILSPHLTTKVRIERLRLDEVISDGFMIKGFNETWVSDRELIYRDPDGSVMLYNVATKWANILASNASLSVYEVERYSVSADKKYMLFASDLKIRNTYSFGAKYRIYDTRTGQASILDADGTKSGYFDCAEWGPTGTQMIVINKNNIVYIPSIRDRGQQLTNSGKEGRVYNGIPDLMYEEFILKSNKAFWWSNDGSKLAFIKFDSENVDQMPVVLYGSGSNASATESREKDDPLRIYQEAFLYPKVFTHPYPKPGHRNPLVSLWVSDLTTPIAGLAKQVLPPSEAKDWEYYITAVRWINNVRLSVVWTKRSQNVSLVSLCDEANGWKCEKLSEEKLGQAKGWLAINDAPHSSEDESIYIMKLPVADGPFGTFDHVAQLSADGKKFFLTHGRYVVKKIIAYRSTHHLVYFLATSPEDPGSVHLYSVSDMEHASPREIRCLSCETDPTCFYFDALFGPKGKYYLLRCLGPSSLRSELRIVDNNKLIDVMNTFPQIREKYDRKAMPKIRYLKVPLDKELFARVKLILPPSLDESDDKKYPVLVEIKNEPGSQSVNYQNELNWSHYLVSKRDYVVLNIDVRGSGSQGYKLEHQIYHHLGEFETEDIIKVVRVLKHDLQYIDQDKVAIWGKGFGGYLVTSLMLKDPVFNCGIAVAPITSWRNYISAFVERYMGTPSTNENFIHYDKSDILRNVRLMKQKEFLIVHGTADRKVNIQHSMLLMKALSEAGVPFKLQLYPDGDHSLRDERLHLYTTMEDFFAKCFQLEDEEDEREIEFPITRVIKGGKRIIIGDD